MNTEQDHTEQLNKVMHNVYFNHRGVLVEKLIGGYRWQGSRFLTLPELDKEIDRVCGLLNGSNEKGKP